MLMESSWLSGTTSPSIICCPALLLCLCLSPQMVCCAELGCSCRGYSYGAMAGHSVCADTGGPSVSDNTVYVCSVLTSLNTYCHQLALCSQPCVQRGSMDKNQQEKKACICVCVWWGDSGGGGKETAWKEKGSTGEPFCYCCCGQTCPFDVHAHINNFRQQLWSTDKMLALHKDKK